jgi:hypothetical protein
MLAFFKTLWDCMFPKMQSTASLVPDVPSDAIVPTSVPNSSTPPAILSHSVTSNSTTVVAPRAPVTGPTIAIMNFSTVVTDAEVQTAMAAAQIQIDRDFAPIWGLSANLVFVPKIKRPDVNAWVMQVLDTSDQAGALGYHTMTNADMPVGKIFCKDDQKYNLSWTVTLTHELLEMLGDPYIDTTVFVQDSDTTGNLIAYENCDPVEDDSLGYLINGVLVTDFVLPAYFESGRAPKSTKFDFKGVLTDPLSIASGGYISIFPVNPTTKGWSQQTGAEGIGPRLASKINRPDTRIDKRTHKFKS